MYNKLNWALTSCLNHNVESQISDKEFKDSVTRKEKSAAMFSSARVLSKFGWNKGGTGKQMFKEIWNDATGKDFELHEATKGDFQKFKWELADRERWLEKGFSPHTTLWKILGAKLKVLPGGSDLHRNIQAIQAYHRRHTEINKGRVSEILESTSKLAKTLKVDVKELEKLELKLQNAEDNTQKNIVLGEIKKFMGSFNSEGTRTNAGDLFLSIRDVMENTPVENLRRTIKHSSGDPKKVRYEPWDTGTQQEFIKIRDNWFKMRKDLVKVLLNSIRTEKEIISNIDRSQGGRRRLTEYLDRLEGYVKTLEFSETATPKGRSYDVDGREVHEFGLNGNKHWQLNTELGYMPHFVLGLTKDLQKFNDYAHDVHNNKSAFEVFKDQVNLFEQPGGVMDRLKSRGNINQEYYSRNPFLFLNKYLHEVTSYNHSTAVKKSMQGVMNYLLKAKIEGKDLGDPEFVDMFVEQASKQLNLLSDNLLYTGSKAKTWQDWMSRLITSFQFHRLMGWNRRTAVRNMGQKLLDRVKLGYGIRNESKKYLSDTENKGFMQQEAEKHGLGWYRDQGVISKISSEWKTNSERGTEGSIESRDLPPGLREVVKADGSKVIELDPVHGPDMVLNAMEGLSAKSSFMHSAVESANRYSTFEVAFARAHKNLTLAPEWYIRESMNQPNATRKQQLQWIKTWAGKLSYNIVSDVHFEYGKVDKAQIFSGPKGKVIGQFQHYRMSLFDFQWNIAKRGYRDVFAEGKLNPKGIVSGLYKGEHARQAIRHMVTYRMVDFLTKITGFGFSNLLSNDVGEWIHAHKVMMTAERDEEGNLTEAGQKAIADVTFRKGVWYDFGATVGLVIDMGELAGVWEVDQTSVMPWLNMLQSNEFNSIDEENWKYKALQLINTQLARDWHKTLPSITNGNVLKAAMQDLGLFTDYETHKKHDAFWEWIRGLTGIGESGGSMIKRRGQKQSPY